jgi:Ca-activated chloride channel family protein
MMRQIILVTDGCSNEGMSPIVAASHALAEGIVVNVIGVMDQGELGQKGRLEISDIAKAGGGVSRIVNSQHLAQTMQMVTRKTVSHTIQQVVNKELRQMMGITDLEDLHPNKRAQVVQTIDELSETADLQIALLIDTSLSMKTKLPAVQEAMQDLLLSLQARLGKSELAVFHFPASEKSEEAEMDTAWTQELAKLPNLFYKLSMKGMTPTGPALLQVIRFIQEHRASTRNAKSEISHNDKDGMLSDYVV